MPNIVKWGSSHKLVLLLGVMLLIFVISTVVLAVKLQQNTTRVKLNIERTKTNDKKLTEKQRVLRLPRNVVPKNYNLTLTPNLSTKLFDGFVIIQVKVVEPTEKILLHASKKLNISNVNVKHLDKEIARFQNVIPDKTDVIHLYLSKVLFAGCYEISATYSGSMDKKMDGLYVSTLRNGRTIVASFFEPTYARRAFPCFDEPDFKATFDVTLVKPASHVALSNMNEISKKHDEATNTDAVTFARSVPMSTYLACFVICEFDNKESRINANGVGNDFTLSSYAQKGEMDQIDFAQNIAKRALEFFIHYLEVPFPLPKIDMIAIPDFKPKGSENWGLVTYKEALFLIDEATAAAPDKISVATTVIHELAHMWFGNLVTMKWWNDIWLKEGFANFMQYKCINTLEPSWTMMDQFLTLNLHPALVTDAMLSSHSIVQNVETPVVINALYGFISYNKASAVLKMLEDFIGEENFRKGISDYLKKFKFGNTVTQDLLNSLEPYFIKDNTNLNFSYIMDTWTRQMGYPVLKVKPGDKPKTYVVTQSRFLLDPEAEYSKEESQFGYRWYIPITFKTYRGPSHNITWLSDSAENVSITLQDGDEWFKINNNQVGYYRVSYTEEIWNKLIKQLKSKSDMLTISDRAHLLNDIFALAEARLELYPQALELMTYLTVEEQFVPWKTAADILETLHTRLLYSQGLGDLQKFVHYLIKPLYNKQSWETRSSTFIGSLLQTTILKLAIRFALPEAQSKVRALFLKLLKSHGSANATNIDSELRSMGYTFGAESATEEEWDKLWQIYLDNEDAQEKETLKYALAAPMNTNVLAKLLTLAWDEKNMRVKDYFEVIRLISGNPFGTALVWDHYRANWPQLVERSSAMTMLITHITKSFNTDHKLKEMEDFFAKYPSGGAGKTARRSALETCKNNIKWTKHNEGAVTQWLSNYVKDL